MGSFNCITKANFFIFILINVEYCLFWKFYYLSQVQICLIKEIINKTVRTVCYLKKQKSRLILIANF